MEETLPDKEELLRNEGMYLYLADNFLIDLSKDHVRSLAEEYWNNPSKLPPHIRDNKAFKTCDVCPFVGQDVLCSALKPLLPFLEQMDRFNSYDKVTAVYMKPNGDKYISDTTMQRALQYVTNMAIFEYCEHVKENYKYFRGIESFMDMNQAVSLLFLNVFWLKKGNSEEVIKTIDEIILNITVTSTNCVNRLKLICKSDAFLNAYVRTCIFADMLRSNIVNVSLEEYFNDK